MPTTPPKKLAIVTRAPNQLGQAIERFRGQRNLSQAALAKSAGLRQATISKVENGTGATEIETIYAICAALGLELVLRPRGTDRELPIEDLF